MPARNVDDITEETKLLVEVWPFSVQIMLNIY